MSYHLQQNNQQKSVGLFIVIAFHVVLILVLAHSLGVDTICVFPTKIIKAVIIEEKPTKIIPPKPIDPTPVQFQQKDNLTLPLIDIEIHTDGKGAVNAKTTADSIPQVSYTKPTIKKASKPDYPLEATRLGEQGTTGMSLYIDENGKVVDAKLLSSSGSARLDSAALKHAARNWLFTPCKENGKAVACWHNTKLVWKLEEATR